MRDPMRNEDGSLRIRDEFDVVTLSVEQVNTINLLGTASITLHCEMPWRAVLVYAPDGIFAVAKNGEYREITKEGDFSWKEWQEKNIAHAHSGGGFLIEE